MSEPRFALFSGDYYYPAGGFDDWCDTYKTLEEAQAAHRPRRYAWAHIVDLEMCEIMVRCEGQRGYWEAA